MMFKSRAPIWGLQGPWGPLILGPQHAAPEPGKLRRFPGKKSNFKMFSMDLRRMFQVQDIPLMMFKSRGPIWGPQGPWGLLILEPQHGAPEPGQLRRFPGKKSNFKNVFDGPETYVSSTRYTLDDVQVSGPNLEPPGPFNLRVSIWGPQGPTH